MTGDEFKERCRLRLQVFVGKPVTAELRREMTKALREELEDYLANVEERIRKDVQFALASTLTKMIWSLAGTNDKVPPL